MGTLVPQSEWSGILNDRPVDDIDQDSCGFRPRAEQFGRLIQQWAGMDPVKFGSSLFLAIHGQWGSGKTSLALQINDWLGKNPKAVGNQSGKLFEVQWNYLSTWKCPTRDAFLRLMVARMLDAVRKQAKKSGNDTKKTQYVLENCQMDQELLPPAMESIKGTLKFSQFLALLETALYQAAEETIATSARINWGNALFSIVEMKGISKFVPMIGPLITALRKALNRKIAESRVEQSPPDKEIYEELKKTVAFHQVRTATTWLAPLWANGGRCSRKYAESIAAQLALTQQRNAKARRSHRRRTIRRLHDLGIVLKNTVKCYPLSL